MDGWVDGWTGGWVNAWKDGWSGGMLDGSAGVSESSGWVALMKLFNFAAAFRGRVKRYLLSKQHRGFTHHNARGARAIVSSTHRYATQTNMTATPSQMFKAEA